MQIEATMTDFEILMINAFRYAMPRFMTTAFDSTERIILNNLQYLQTWALKQFLEDIDWERQYYATSKNSRIFSDDDPACRDDFYNKIKAEIERRESKKC